jgi:hypothetical protein
MKTHTSPVKGNHANRQESYNHSPGNILAQSFETILMAVLLGDRRTLCNCEQLATG